MNEAANKGPIEGKGVRFPLVVKLIGMISLIVVIAMAAVTGIATWFFAEDSRVSAEVNNLALNRAVALQMESEITSIHTGALTLIDNLREGRGSAVQGEIAVSNYFTRNPSVAWIGVPGEKTARNEAFFRSYEIPVESVDEFLRSQTEVAELARAGDYLLVNASVALGVPAAALFAPCRDFGTDNYLACVFSTASFQGMVQTDSAASIMAVGYDGGLIVHPDFAAVKRGANLSDDPLVSKSLVATSTNMEFRYRDADGRESLGAFHKIPLGNVTVLSSVPLETVYVAAVDVARRNIIITAIVVLLSILAVWFFSKTVSQPVLRLVEAARRIEKGEFDVAIKPTSRDELGLLTRSFSQMGKGLAERERIKETFGKFVNKEVAEQALTGNLALGGVRKTATIFFSDIRSFTSISERLAPEAVVEFLNEYMTRMVSCVEKTGGVVDKFIGDAIMAVWGAPVSKGDAARDAFSCLHAAIAMRHSLIEFNKGRGSADKPIIRIGCGINTGPCLAGQIGSAQRMEYTVIGDAVNLASRIEALNKPFGTDILVSHHTYELLRNYLVVEPMPPIKVKGKVEPLKIYAVVNLRGESGPTTLGELRALLGIEAPKGLVDPEKEEVKYEILPK